MATGTSWEALRGARVLMGVSASIAAHRALDLASFLRKQGAEVRAVLTEHVPNLIGPAAFDAITHQRTITTLWGSDHAGEMDHLAVTKWAQAFVIVPATANILATLAHGIAGDALGTFAIAWNKAPMLIAPAMNPEMWRNVAVQENVATLRRRGHLFVGPVSGRTACDDEGEGRLVPAEEIAHELARLLAKGAAPKRLAGKRILITGGPTREFADLVRCITNPSTGKQALALAEAARAEGADVTLVMGPTEISVPAKTGKVIRVVTADEMLAAVLKELPAADAAIFAAAVSDWKPATRFDGKEKKTSQADHMSLELVRTPDIAFTANQHRRPDQIFVGFAAEAENLRGYAEGKMQRKGFSLVFANPIGGANAGFGANTNRGLLMRADGTSEEVPMASKGDIAEKLIGELASLFGN